MEGLSDAAAKSQIPKPKSQQIPSSKVQTGALKAMAHLGLEIWDWDLELGISLA